MSLKFSHEPAVYVGLLLAILSVVKSVLMHEALSETIIEPVIIALSAVFVRQKVTPVAKINEARQGL
jgi:hypothetical protein